MKHDVTSDTERAILALVLPERGDKPYTLGEFTDARVKLQGLTKDQVAAAVKTAVEGE